MYIHNTVEDIVINHLEEILSLKDNICKCEQCKTDMICYSLNRIKPMYVVSSRGIIHTENKKREHIQEEIDIYSTVVEAVEVVSNTRRHKVNNEYKNIEPGTSAVSTDFQSETGCFYNFPQIVGRVFDSSTLNPIMNAKISLRNEKDENLVIMFNKLWSNPISLVPQTNGTYTFWPKSIQAEKPKIQKDFHFYLQIEADNFQIICKFFFIRLISDEKISPFIKKENIFYINDIFLNPEGFEEEE